MNCKPYIEILNKRGYFVVEEDEELLNISEGEEAESEYHYYPTYSRGSARVELDLVFIGPKAIVSNYVNGNKNFEDLNLEIERIAAYYVDYTDYTNDYGYDCEDNTRGLEYRSGVGNSLINISRITPELFNIMLDIEESEEAEFNHFHKIIQRYLDVYNNIIKIIVNPVAKLKKLRFVSTLVTNGFRCSGIYDTDEVFNKCIELMYFDSDYDFKFSIGVDFLTGKLFYYKESRVDDVLFDFENLITTKGRFKELIERT